MADATANKVKYGLKNMHYALLTLADDGTGTFGTPVKVPGAVSLTLDAQGDVTNFRADNIDYYVTHKNSGYDGTLEMALIPDKFREEVLKEVKDTNGVYVEDANPVTQPFALLFQFEGDQSETLHVVYNCTAGRPSVSSNTTERNAVEPVTESMPLTASTIHNAALNKDIVKARTGADTAAATKSGWFEAVYQPTANS